MSDILISAAPPKRVARPVFKANVAQGALSVIARIKPGHVEAVRTRLREIKPGDVENNPLVPFGKIISVHFARFVILEESKDLQGRTLPACLALSTNYDKPLDTHLRELVDVAGPGLESIFSHCEGYPAGEGRGDARVRALAFLRANQVPYVAFYIGTRGRSVGQVRYEAELRNAIQGYLDKASGRPDFLVKAPLEIRNAIQAFVKENFPEAEEYYHGEKRPSLPAFLDKYAQLAAVPGSFAAVVVMAFVYPLPVLLLLGGAVLLFVALLRTHETRDPQAGLQVNAGNVKDLAERENQIVQNQLTHLVDIKPGAFRLMTLGLVLRSINLLAGYFFNKGKLGEIPTIHFARWVIIDKGRRLLFFSNFDGSWENYLGDFVDKAAVGLTGVWSNTVGFPKTRWLVLDGATDEQRFKAWNRNHQITTQVWYSAYKTLTVDNINNNSEICRLLFTPMNEQQAIAWLQKL